MNSDVLVPPDRQIELLEQWRSDITGLAVEATRVYCEALADAGDPVTQIALAVVTSHVHDIGRMRQVWTRASDAVTRQFVIARVMQKAVWSCPQ